MRQANCTRTARRPVCSCVHNHLRKGARSMSQTFSLPCVENAVPHQSIVETPAAKLFFRDFCTAPFVESLKPDAGLRAFARLPEREHQLLRKIAERPDSILTLAYTNQGVIVGQV